MKESQLRTLSIEFAVKILQLIKELKAKKETILANQIARSGTSVGANIHEAQYAQGRADFISKLQIALKEANETLYWLILLQRTEAISQLQFDELSAACTTLKVMLIASLNKLKANA